MIYSLAELRKEIHALHEPPSRALAGIVEPLLLGSNRNISLVTKMITNMVNVAGTEAIENGSLKDVLKELKDSVGQVLNKQ